MMHLQKAFTLIELLVVLAIIGAMAALVIPATSNILGGSNISAGAETVMGALTNARQFAATQNREVEFRLIETADPLSPALPTAIRAVQLLEPLEDGTYKAEKVRKLPRGIIIGSSQALSSVCTLDSTAATESDPSIPQFGRTYNYRSFRFRPDGSANLSSRLPAASLPPSANGLYFLTIYDEKFASKISGSTPPPNFATIQIEPATGAAILYRP